LDSTVAYARERVQFDRPIGSFQGVQFQLVDAGLDLQRASAAVSYAAMCVDADDEDRHRAVHVAKAAAGTAARHAAKVGLQVHGGIGYTWEHDLHLYLRRAYASDDLLGDVAWHHDRLADLVLG
jgi:alkylation response protein AidB-like acyl-CoA dehydrogenase